MSYSPPGAYEPAFWSVSSHDLRHVDRVGGQIGTNTAWVANLAVYVPFLLNQGGTIYEWWHVNGTLTTAYNVDYGIYNMDFTKVQSLGSTAGTTTASAVVNTTTWTDLVIAPGSYYMAFASDSTRNFNTSNDPLGIYQASGIMQQSTAFVLPSPAVPVVYANAFLPQFGFNMKTTAV